MDVAQIFFILLVHMLHQIEAEMFIGMTQQNALEKEQIIERKWTGNDFQITLKGHIDYMLSQTIILIELSVLPSEIRNTSFNRI